MDFPRVVAMPALVGHHSVLVDLLGHGYSDGPQDFDYSLEEHAKTVAELLEHLALRECALFGHSMGGAVAITLAALRPELVSRLVIAEGNLDPGGGIISTAIATQTEEVFKTRGRQAVVDKALEAGSMTRVASFRACAPHAFVRSAAGLVRGTQPTMRERLYSLSIPRAYLFGEKGLPDPETEVLASHGVQVLTVAKSGHDMAFDNPAGLAEAIESALSMSAGRPAKSFRSR